MNFFSLTPTAVRCIAVALFFCLVAPPEGSAQTTLSQTYLRVKKSLALVVYQDDRGTYSGTAFCVGSSDTSSYFLTNAHVVGGQREVSVVLPNEPGPPHRGTVLRVNTDIDLALVSITVAHLPTLAIGDDVLPEGQPIAIAGYPATHIQFMIDGLGLLPSLHEGTVNSYPNDGSFLEFDAQAEHGNSGGPVFDPQTGIVYGVVRLKIGDDQTNLAIPVSRVTGFLTNAGVMYTHGTQTAQSATPTPSPEAQPQTSVTAKQNDPSSASDFSKTRRFATYVPLRNRKQTYDCDSGANFTVTIRGVPNGKSYDVTSTFSGIGATSASSRSILAHDASNNLVLLAQYDDAGNLLWLPQPLVTVPLMPGTNVKSEMANDEGTTSPQKWLGATNMYFMGGHHDVQGYYATFKDGRSEVDLYSDHFGLVGSVMFSRAAKPTLGCILTGISDNI